MTTTREPEITAPPPTEVTGGHARWREAAGWLRANRGLIVLLAVPFVVFGVPELFGRVFLAGDNLLQNLPMRVLAGRSILHGELPLWNPYLFSGTPLLGGFNAGAAYPATWLTAVLPIYPAWTLNLALAYDVALAGMYLFLVRQSISRIGALFGAATFAFSGYMTAQIVHIDLIEGAAWLPWTLAAVHALTGGPVADGPTAGERTRSRTASMKWVALLAASLGLSLLTGAAEAIIDASVLVAIYAVGRLVTMGYVTRGNARALVAAVLTMLAGVAWGVALGTVQWLPGLQFLSASQRAQSSYGFFISGSLPVRNIALIFTPFLLGTRGIEPGGYAGLYNFEEVTSYVGILALIAAGSLWLKRFRTRPEARHWWIWYIIAAVGVLSAFGGQTPFGHVLYLIPGISAERLLNRNLLLVDFSLAVLLAWWVHLLFEGRRATGGEGATTVPARRRSGRRAEIAVTCAPLAVIGALCLFFWLGGPQLERLLRIQIPVSTVTRMGLAGLVTASAVIAAVATRIVLVESRLSARRLRRLLVTVLAVDLILFNCFVIDPPTTESAGQAQGPLSSALHAQVGDARFIIYDPDEFETSQLYQLGQTDLNIYAGLPSGQGYTALTDGAYYQGTGAHYQEDLNPAALAGGTWDDLNVSTLLSLPGYFLTPLPRPAPGPTVDDAAAVPFPGHIGLYNSSPTPVAGSYDLSAGQTRTWYFGSVLTADSLTVPLLTGQPGDLRVGLVTTTGGVGWLPSSEVIPTVSDGPRSLRIALASPTRSAGLVVESVGGTRATVGTPTAVTAETGGVALDGRMQYGVTRPHWAFAGMIGSFAVFHNTRARGWGWVSSPGGGPAPSGSSVITQVPRENGDQQATVVATSPVVLERSESWSPGWRATVQPVSSSSPHPATGPARVAAVVRVGLTQGVDLPGPGDYVVSFSYAPGKVALALAVSALAALGLIVCAVVELVGWRRRRRSRRDGGGTGPDRLNPA